jgi:hypothetical protein
VIQIDKRRVETKRRAQLSSVPNRETEQCDGVQMYRRSTLHDRDEKP